MSRRPFGLMSLTVLVFALGILGAAGLGWVTVSSLTVEDHQRTSAAAAERAEKERLALWKLDGRVAPALGLEAIRQYEHFTALYAPPGDITGGPQFLSPLVSAGLPDWIPLHFQFDPSAGWTSPQVLPEAVVARLANPANDLDLSNLTDERRTRLAELNRRFPVARTAEALKSLDADTSDSSAVVVAVVPSRPPDVSPLAADALPPGAVPPSGLTSPKGSSGFGANGRVGPASPPAYTGNTAMAQQSAGRAPAETSQLQEDSAKRKSFSDSVNREIRGGLGNSQVINPKDKAPDHVDPSANDTPAKSGEKGERGVPHATGAGSATTPAPAAMAAPAGPPATGGIGGGGPAGGRPPAPRGASRPLAPPAPGAIPPDVPPAGAPGPLALNPMSMANDVAKAGSPLPVKPEPTTGAPRGGVARSEKQDARANRDVSPGVSKKLDDTPLAVKKPAPPVPPVAVHLGAMRPMWLAAVDGKRELVVVRPARLEGKTVYQGALLDWEKLRDVLKEEVADDFPTADLVPSDGPADAPRHQLSALPVRFDAGPLPAPPPSGWTPLRLGLALAWLAATVALVAVWFGGWSLVDLSERRIRFVSAVTHELRTPLTSLRLYLDMLTSGMVTDETQKAQYLTTLSHESNRLNQLIENVLDFAKLEKRAGVVQKQSVPVVELIDHCRETWAERLSADGKEFVAVSTVPTGQTVTADPRIAQQILGNLIDNARKYSPGATDPRVWLWVKPAGKRVAFEVEDRGPGIPAAERTSIFRPFRRGGTSGATGGAGLGLALAKQWAESLGGKLTCRLADGGAGACFRLELPA